MTLDTFQLGEPVEHRGIVVAPLFPQPRPGRGLHHARRGAAARAPRSTRVRRGHRARARRREPARRTVLLYDGEELVGAKQNRILNVSVLVEARREAADPRLLRRAGPLAPAQRRVRLRRPHLARAPAAAQGGGARRAAARPRRRAGRGVGRGAARSRRAWASTRRPAPAGTRSRRTAAALRALESAFPLAARPVRRAARARRRPLPRRRLAARRVRAALAEAPRRLPARRARAARRPRDTGRANLGVRRRGRRRRARRAGRRPGSARTSGSAAPASSARGSSSTAS